MVSTATLPSVTETGACETISGVRVGWIVSRLAAGGVLVDYPGNTSGVLPARSTVRIAPNDQKRDVLLVFEGDDPRRPIVTGVLQDQCEAVSDGTTREKLEDVLVDGRRVVFDARREIVLRCGKSSVTLNKDGRIVVRGTEIISRASRSHKIKGASVAIN